MRDPKYLTWAGHLEEFRSRLLVSVAAVTAAAVACFFSSDKLLAFLARPLGPQAGPFYFFSPAEAFTIKVKVSLLAGLLAASPVVFYQIWLYVSPALRAQERKVFLPLVAISSLLFAGGAVFCFFAVMPTAMSFLVGMQTDILKPMLSLNEYISFLSGMVLAFGVAFNLPLFILAIVASGAMSAKALNRYQRHAIVLIFIAAAVLTPSPDVASQFLLAMPLLGLFEISVVAAFVIDAMRHKVAVASRVAE